VHYSHTFFAKFLRKVIHKLKIDLSNILAAKHTNVQLVAKEDFLFDFVYHYGWRSMSLEIPLDY
jgi:hypothetical protein